MDDYYTHISGLPALLNRNEDGAFVSVTFADVLVDGEPLVVPIAPPATTTDDVDYPAILAALTEAEDAGASIQTN